MDDWAKQRLAELQAAVPVKGKKATPFVKVSLAAAVKACTAVNCPKAIVWIWLVHRVWHQKSRTIAVPNGALAKLGVSREMKRRALQQLETAGLVILERPSRKTLLVTLL
jgi:hypothetical protein